MRLIRLLGIEIHTHTVPFRDRPSSKLTSIVPVYEDRPGDEIFWGTTVTGRERFPSG
jgi:hypothetical protein